MFAFFTLLSFRSVSLLFVLIVCNAVLVSCDSDMSSEFYLISVPDITDRDYSTSEYPDVNLVVHASRAGTQQIVNLVLPFLRDREKTSSVGFESGDLVRVMTRPLDQISESIRQMQMVDELPPIDGQWLYAERVLQHEKSKSPQVELPAPPRSDERRGVQKIETLSQRQIIETQRMIQARVRQNGGSFECWQQALAPFRETAYPIWGGEIGNTEAIVMRCAHFREGVSHAGLPPRLAIKQLAHQVRQRGVRFLYLSLPMRHEIYPEWFGDFSTLDTSAARLELLSGLLEDGVEVVDAGELLSKEKTRTGRAFRPFWKAKDSHLTPQGHAVIGLYLAEYLWKEGLLPADGMRDFPQEVIEISAPKSPDKRMKVRQVTIPEHPTLPEILLVGDSNLFFYQNAVAKNCGLPSQLAGKCGFSVDWKSIAGMQPHTVGRYDAPVLSSKKLLIFVHTAWLLHDERSPMLPVTLK